jgi:hypothetical protein
MCRIAPEILKVFKLTRLDKVFDICADPEAASESFGKRRRFFLTKARNSQH